MVSPTDEEKLRLIRYKAQTIEDGHVQSKDHSIRRNKLDQARDDRH